MFGYQDHLLYPRLTYRDARAYGAEMGIAEEGSTVARDRCDYQDRRYIEAADNRRCQFHRLSRVSPTSEITRFEVIITRRRALGEASRNQR